MSQRSSILYSDLAPGSADHRRFYAAFAKAAYDRSFKVPEGYYLDPRHSNRNRALYVNPETMHAVYAHRGTVPGLNKTGWQDLSTDAMLAFGGQALSSRFANAVKFGRNVQKDYPDYHIETTGHSLGGSLARYSGQKLGIPHVGFAPHLPTGSLKNELLNTAAEYFYNSGNTRQEYNYTAALDPVGVGAAIGRPRNTTVVPMVGSDPHALANFLA